MNTFPMETYLKELEVLVNIDSGFGACDGATQTGLLLAEPLVQQGWILERHKVSDKCGECIVVKNREADHYDVMLVGHTDTVFPAGETQKRPFRRDEKRAYGVGVIDMKQGCLAITYILKDLPKEALDKLNIVAVFNPDEEIGSTYSRELVDEIARHTSCALIFEAAGGVCTRTIQRKGLMRVHAEFHGKAGHAGYAFENGGINAVNEMAYWICELAKLHDPSTGTSINAGVVQGGQAVNVIPDHAEAQFDIRFEKLEEMERVTALLETLAQHAAEKGVTITERPRRSTPPMVPSEATHQLCRIAAEVADDLGLPFALKKRGGLSDANHISTCGCATLDSMGPTGNHDHSVDEYLELATIEPNIRLGSALLCKLAEMK